MRILVIEDEASIQDRIVRLSKKCLGDRVQNIFTADTIEEGFDILKTEIVDLLLLDLNVNGEDGFQVLREFLAKSFHTIVISAYPERAIEAYELGVIDFITKPFDEERLNKGFSRVYGMNETAREHFAKFLAVRKFTRIELIPIEDIKYIQADGGYSQIFLKSGRREMHDKMLKDIALLLPPMFERIHKSYIINTKIMTGINSKGSHKHFAILNSADEIPLSRSKYKELKTQFSL